MPPSTSARAHTPTAEQRRPSARGLMAVAATVIAATATVAAGGGPGVARAVLAEAVTVGHATPDARDAASGELIARVPSPAPAPITAPAPDPTPGPAPAAAPVPRVPVQALSASRPAPAPLSAARVVPVVAPPPVPLVRNLLVSADGSLRTAVGTYTDCSGNSPLTDTEAAIDTCVAGPTYFVGHNYGVFTPLMSMSVGAIITWYDRNGVAHPMRIVSIRDGYASAGGAPRPTQSGIVAQFQTCEPYSPTGAYDRILDAVRA